MDTTQNQTSARKPSIFKKPWVQSLTGIFLILIVAATVLFYKSTSSRISITESLVSAPVIAIGPENPGVLEEVYVKAGDTVSAGDMLARVGAQILSAKISGTIITVNNTPGQVFQPSQAVVTMIDPKEFRIIGTVKENAGLSDIKVGDPVSFTVDAFAGKKFTGVVDSISPTSKESGVAFSISDKREVKQFEVKVKYDVVANPEFKNGMSAKMKIYTK
jgi:multidrug resistance efflux pump